MDVTELIEHAITSAASDGSTIRDPHKAAAEVVKVLRQYGHLDPTEQHRFNERHVTLQDLFRLAYFTGEMVFVTVTGRDVLNRIHHAETSFTIPDDEPELLRRIEHCNEPKGTN